jgi:hypothetical protein
MAGDEMSDPKSDFETNPIGTLERLRRCQAVLKRLLADAEITGLDKQAGWDFWFTEARALTKEPTNV